jgi:hypothetical protein
MDIGFIHIGMMKTASTYMQNIWLRDKAYCLSWKGNINFLNSLRDAVIKDNLNEDPELDIKTDINYQEGQKLVISNEGFSTSYLNKVNFQHKMLQFIDYASRNLGRLSNATSNLLVVVREPVSWLKSIYVQSIKQGWNGCAQNFIEHQYRYLRHSLDLEFIVNCYKRYFRNILVVPYEILKKGLFWNVISEAFQVPYAEERIDSTINQSLDLERIFLLSKLNEISGVLSNNLIYSKKFNNIQEKNQIVNNYLNSGKWVHRRFVEFANNEQLNEIYNLFNISKPPENFLDFSIPVELKEVIESKYIGFLRKNIIPEFADSYEQKLQNHVSK